MKISELFYLIHIAIFFFAKGIGLYDGQPVFRLVIIAALVFCGAKMLLTAYTVKEFAIIAALLLLGGIVYLVSGEKAALLYIIMICGMKNVPLSRVMKVAGISWIISYGGMLLLTATHILPSAFMIHERLGLGHLIRWSLGQSHPNVLHISYLTLAMFVVYLLGSKVNLKWLTLLMLGNLYVYLFSLSSTGLIGVSFFLALTLYLTYRKTPSMLEKAGLSLMFPLCLVVSFAAPLALSGRAFDIANRLLNTRLTLSQTYLLSRPVSLFGTRLSTISNKFPDSSYVFSYVSYGIILFSIIVIAYFFLIHRGIKENRKNETGITLSALFAGLTEPFLFNSSFKNVSLLFLGDLLFSRSAGKERISFLPESMRKAALTLPGFMRKVQALAQALKSAYEANRKRLLLLTVLIAIAGGLVAAVTFQRPDVYLANRFYTDIASTNIESHPIPDNVESMRIVELGEINEDDDIWYSYKLDGETDLAWETFTNRDAWYSQTMVFDGHMADVEWLRHAATWGLVWGVVCFVVFLFFTGFRGYVKIRKDVTE